MKIRVQWYRKLGHLYQSCVKSGDKIVYGYGITRGQATKKAKERLVITKK